MESNAVDSQGGRADNEFVNDAGLASKFDAERSDGIHSLFVRGVSFAPELPDLVFEEDDRL